NNSSMLEDSAKIKTNTSSLQSSIKLSNYRAGETQVLSKDTKVSHDYIVAQDFIQEVSSELFDAYDIQIIDGNQKLLTDMTIEVELAHLFLKVSIEGKNTTQVKQKEILYRYLYGKKFKKGVQKIIAKDNISEQKARKQLFQDIIKHLSKITLETLRKRTQRAIKIYKLFEKIRIDRIKNIKSYSADSISNFTKPQVQIILDYFSGSGYTDTELKKPNSYSGYKNVEKVRPKVPLEKSQGYVLKKLPDVRINTPPTSQTSKTNQTNVSEMQEKCLDSVEVNILANISSSRGNTLTYY
ncbi:13915_t:CDS:2, partial [Funneliformis geosporum]